MRKPPPSTLTCSCVGTGPSLMSRHLVIGELTEQRLYTGPIFVRGAQERLVGRWYRQSMTVCIAGMHRSHTSMVARMLHVIGISIGSADNFLPASADNAEGYWEDSRFVDLNDEILRRLGGTWRHPPDLEPGWSLDSRFHDLREKASTLRDPDHSPKLWGWKDPRNCLTFEFWARTYPDLKCVLCLRHPLEVAQSLFDRVYLRLDYIPVPAGIDLWQVYNDQILAAAAPEQLLVTHGTSYYFDPRAELKRVANFLGIDVSDSQLDLACATVASKLGGAGPSAGEPLGRELPPSVLDLYRELAGQAGPVFAASQSDPAFQENLVQARAIRCSRRAQALEDAYVALDEERTRTEADLAKHATVLSEELGRITATRWWRLRERWAPILVRGRGGAG